MQNNSAARVPTPQAHTKELTRHIVIIDDNHDDLNALSKMVLKSRAPQCRVAKFHSVEQAITSGQLQSADLILLDDRLEGGTTAEHSLETLHNAGVTCPAIVLSAIVRHKRDRTVIRHGAVQFTSKEELDAKSMQRLLAYGLSAQGLWAIDGN